MDRFCGLKNVLFRVGSSFPQGCVHKKNKIGIVGLLLPGDFLLDEDARLFDEPGIDLYLLGIRGELQVSMKKFQPLAVQKWKKENQNPLTKTHFKEKTKQRKKKLDTCIA